MSRTTRARRRAARPGGLITDDGRKDRRGFTLIELLVVVVVLAILMALLLPAINSAIRTSQQAAVQAEINQLAAALENFKSKYGDYPPSRLYVAEDGDYSAATVPPSQSQAIGPGDITISQLAQRSLAALRRFFPRLRLNTSGGKVWGPYTNPPPQGSRWYDFNGNGLYDGHYILQGHECLVFFLGGVPLPNDLVNLPSSFGLTGFGKDPDNPFSNGIAADPRYNGAPNPMYNANRLSPFYDFNPGRLFLDLSNTSLNGGSPGVPAYYDTLNSGPPTYPLTGTGTVNFYAYFSAYGNGNYDPNDVNIYEVDVNAQGPIGLQYWVNFPTSGGTASAGNNTTYVTASPSPNPYTTTLTAGSPGGTVTYQKPQTFQIISAGVDGLYGVGGQYVQQSTSSTEPLPFDSVHSYNGGTRSAETDSSIRQRESDNLTNFKSGTLR